MKKTPINIRNNNNAQTKYESRSYPVIDSYSLPTSLFQESSNTREKERNLNTRQNIIQKQREKFLKEGQLTDYLDKVLKG